MIYPDFLKPTDKVVVLSPSGHVESKWIEGIKSTLSSYGLNVVIAENALSKAGRFAGEDIDRISDLQQAINDTQVKAIFCSRGGYGLARIIDKIDFSPLLQYPKWIIGFSDITILHNALNNLGIASVHGIMAKHISLKSEGLDNMMSMLFGKSIELETDANKFNREGFAEGEIIGGNLSILYGLRGTPFDLNYDGKILFIEDLGERLYHIDRMIQNLRLSGVLERISGLVVGQFSDIDDDDSFSGGAYGVIKEAVKNYSYPVCFNFPAGHVDVNEPIMLGAKYKLEVKNNKSILRCLR